MNRQESRQQFEKGETAARNSHFFLAQTCFERAAELEPSLAADSYIAYCRAAARYEHEESIATVRASLEKEPDNPLHYLLLGRIFILAGRRQEAMEIMRQGAHLAPAGEILKELEDFGARRPLVFPRLSRANPLNRISGLILSRLGLR